MSNGKTREADVITAQLGLKSFGRLVAGGFAAAIVMLEASPATAAVHECKPMLLCRRAQAKTELEAKQITLQDWTEKAGESGLGYTRWQIAYNRRIECRKVGPVHECQAVGMPCTVKQVPTEGLETLKRGF